MSQNTFKLSYYIDIARLKRWPLNVFLFPGFVISAIATGQYSQLANPVIILAFFALCLAAFANYSINEYLDGKFDALHPEKKNRPGALGLLNIKLVLLEYALLAICALSLAYFINSRFFALILIFLSMGIIYNVRPFRSKDKAYFDILSESINHPLRFTCGWVVIPHSHFPPVTILLACWMGGAYLMSIKRYAEYRHVNDPERLSLYRKSFAHYNEQKLLNMALFFMLVSGFCFALFLYQLNPMTVFSLPLLASLFIWYTRIGMMENSPAQHPESLHQRTPVFVYYVVLVTTITLSLTLA